MSYPEINMCDGQWMSWCCITKTHIPSYWIPSYGSYVLYAVHTLCIRGVVSSVRLVCNPLCRFDHRFHVLLFNIVCWISLEIFHVILWCLPDFPNLLSICQCKFISGAPVILQSFDLFFCWVLLLLCCCFFPMYVDDCFVHYFAGNDIDAQELANMPM